MIPAISKLLENDDGLSYNPGRAYSLLPYERSIIKEMEVSSRPGKNLTKPNFSVTKLYFRNFAEIAIALYFNNFSIHILFNLLTKNKICRLFLILIKQLFIYKIALVSFYVAKVFFYRQL